VLTESYGWKMLQKNKVTDAQIDEIVELYPHIIPFTKCMLFSSIPRDRVNVDHLPSTVISLDIYKDFQDSTIAMPYLK
jgi:hypothetical protein